MQNRSVTEANESRPTIIFIHIPKTGGTTFRAILRANYDPAVVRSTEALKLRQSIRSIRREHEHTKSSLQLVHGHMGFGLHNFFSQQCRYLTFLRDPVRRVLSHYTYARQDTRQANYSMVRQMTIKEFATINDNYQTRMLCGVNRADTIFGFDPVTKYHLRRAKENLKEAFAAVGIVESFDESVLILQKMLDWEHPYYISKNVSTRSTKPEDYSTDVLDHIKNRNTLDLELYNFACELFYRQIREFGSSFDERLSSFRIKLMETSREEISEANHPAPTQKTIAQVSTSDSAATNLRERFKDIGWKLFLKAALVKRFRPIQEAIITIKGIKKR